MTAFPETKAAWARLKAALVDLRESSRRAKAHRHMRKAIAASPSAVSEFVSAANKVGAAPKLPAGGTSI